MARQAARDVAFADSGGASVPASRSLQTNTPARKDARPTREKLPAGNRLDVAENGIRRAAANWRDWRREIGDAERTTLTTLTRPKFIRVRRFYTQQHPTVNRFVKKVY